MESGELKLGISEEGITLENPQGGRLELNFAELRALTRACSMRSFWLGFVSGALGVGSLAAGALVVFS